MRRGRIALVLLCWIVSLVVVAQFAAAQARQMVPLPEPIVLSGADVGFRVEGRYGTTPAGTWVIRMNGQWVVPQTAPATRPVPAETH